MMRYAVLPACLLISLQQTSAAALEQLDDAWWTGPIVASSAATLPQGHFLIEPYVFDVDSNSTFDDDEHRHSGIDQHYFGTQTYFLYGFTNDFTAGIIERAAFRQSGGGFPDTTFQNGDVTLHGAYRLNRFGDNQSPDVSLFVEETLPTGRYDRLDNPNAATGGGAYATSAGIYTQFYSWLPNGRILRTRFDVAYTHSNSATLRDQSVYGTANGFRGAAHPGDALEVDAAAEYSLSQHWVLSMDLFYHGSAGTTLEGVDLANPLGAQAIHSKTGRSYEVGVAPALEYNFTSQLGLLAGVRVIQLGKNVTGSITPVIAFNVVL